MTVQQDKCLRGTKSYTNLLPIFRHKLIFVHVVHSIYQATNRLEEKSSYRKKKSSVDFIWSN